MVVERGALLMVERGGPIHTGYWAVPGGKVRRGEELAAAAVRETREETGLEVEVGRIVWVGESIGEDHHLVIVDFAARVAGGRLQAGDDARAAEFAPLEKLREYRLTPTMYSLLDALGV